MSKSKYIKESVKKYIKDGCIQLADDLETDFGKELFSFSVKYSDFTFFIRLVHKEVEGSPKSYEVFGGLEYFELDDELEKPKKPDSEVQDLELENVDMKRIYARDEQYIRELAAQIPDSSSDLE